MASVHREVHDDEIVLSNDTMDGRRRMVQIAVESRERLPQAFTTLRPCGVLDEVLGDQPECGTVSMLEGLVERQHGLRRRHRVSTHEASPCVESKSSA